MILGFSNIFRITGCLLVMATLLGCSHTSRYEPFDTEEDGLEIRMNVELRTGGDETGRNNLGRAPGSTGDDVLPEEILQHLRVIMVEKPSGIIVHNRGIVLSEGVSIYDDMRFGVKHSTAYDVYLLGNCQDLDGLGSDLDFGTEKLPVGSVYTAGTIENAVIECAPGTPMINNSVSPVKGIPITAKYSIVTDAPDGKEHQFQDMSFIMIRAAVKFSFNINVSEDFIGVQNDKLTDIRIQNLGNSMYLLPRDIKFYDDDPESEEGIISYTVPDDVTRGTYDFKLPGGGLNLTAGMEGYSWNPLIYFPESSTPEEGFLCTLKFENHQTAIVPVRLPSLPYGMPRNTHVIVGITIGNNNSVRVKVKVLPWDQMVSEFNFSDEVGIGTDGALKFIDGTYYSLDKDNGRLVLKNSVTLKGSFGISTPKGARWDAYLISENGRTDAIQFYLKEDGSNATRISGIVDDHVDNFEIEAVFPPGNEANTAILQVVVTTDDGRGIPINILTGAGYGPEVQNLTIIQNPR